VGTDLAGTTTRRATAAVVLLALGAAVAVGAPIISGDRFRPCLRSFWTGSPHPGQLPNGSVVAPSTEQAYCDFNWRDFTPRYLRFPSTSGLPELARTQPGWGSVAAALVLVPLWFLWWRRSAMSFARGIGVLASAATAAALVTLTWDAAAFCAAHVMVAAPAAYLAAFVVAPPPRVRDAA
jgi:hypothetical protein